MRLPCFGPAHVLGDMRRISVKSHAIDYTVNLVNITGCLAY